MTGYRVKVGTHGLIARDGSSAIRAHTPRLRDHVPARRPHPAGRAGTCRVAAGSHPQAVRPPRFLDTCLCCGQMRPPVMPIQGGNVV